MIAACATRQTNFPNFSTSFSVDLATGANWMTIGTEVA
jgi:hypothetical protein